jgi:hypothetical protein
MELKKVSKESHENILGRGSEGSDMKASQGFFLYDNEDVMN